MLGVNVFQICSCVGKCGLTGHRNTLFHIQMQSKSPVFKLKLSAFKNDQWYL